ncbi:MAG: aminotransferase class V-fold PLP-dependent enzyme [Woeseiaceae bacterium]
MRLTRRELLTAAGCLPIAGLALAKAPVARAGAPLPFKAGFAPMAVTYLDSGSQHPVSLGALQAVQNYLARRALDPNAPEDDRDDAGLLAKYARLVNADPDEVTFVQSTTTGEQMILRALGLPEAGGHVVCDTLHFFGSLPLYEEMARRGIKVTWVRDRDGRIELDDVRKAVRPGTKLVALSLISTINGFQHDLKAVCDIAHAAGALVYADIIHAVGSVPVDLHASGVDFASGASYKWLMGDFGLGFLYARKDLLPRLERSNYGYYGMSAFQSHVYPFDPPGDTVVDYAFQNNATGHFALGTRAHTVIAMLHHSIDYLLAIGVENIQAHAQTLIQRLREELPARGYTVMTPPESKAPMIACACEDARTRLEPRLRDAGVKITVSRNRFRVSTSVFNDLEDIERLLEALGTA